MISTTKHIISITKSSMNKKRISLESQVYGSDHSIASTSSMTSTESLETFYHKNDFYSSFSFSDGFNNGFINNTYKKSVSNTNDNNNPTIIRGNKKRVRFGSLKYTNMRLN